MGLKYNWTQKCIEMNARVHISKSYIKVFYESALSKVNPGGVAHHITYQTFSISVGKRTVGK